VLMPYRTLADPEVQGEGSIDPLGLATLADHLADWMLPGMTARMWRPRFLTAIAVTSLVVEPLEEELAKDGVTPPWLVFEWHYVEAVAALSEKEGNALRRIPGIDKARQAVRDRIPLNATRYLKTPKVFGYHGVYKRLATHVDVVDDSLALGEQGHVLLRTWESEQGLSGFSDRERTEGEAAKLRHTLREAVRQALATGQTERRPPWPGAAFFANHLLPHKMGRQEARALWQLLLDAAEPHGELLALSRESGVREQLARDGSERGAIAALRPRVSTELRLRFDAIEEYERFCRPIQEAWDHLRHLSTVRRPALLRVDDVADHDRLSVLASRLPETIRHTREVLAEHASAGIEFDRVARRFDDVRTAGDLFQVLSEHHRAVQQGKPPEGKRPWVEEAKDGGLIIRPLYRMDEAAVPREEFVHPYRLFAVASFVEDLREAL
jgi:hypothetical protein